MHTVRKLARRLGLRPDPNDAPDGGLPVYMHPIEQSQMVALVEAIAPRRVLEWGSGGSTRALLECGPYIERYVSVEHNPQWHARVAAAVRDPRLELILREPTIPEPPHPDGDRAKGEVMSAWMLECERDASIMASYVAAGVEAVDEVDFVIVDGRARVHCMRAGWDKLRSGGVLMLHDAQRPEYHETVRALGRAVFLEPWEQGQICFVRKT